MASTGYTCQGVKLDHIPHSALMVCAACGEGYDYRMTEERECPKCSCPPPTVRDTTDSRGRIVPNPAHAEFLARVNTGTKPPVNTPPPVNSQPPVSTEPVTEPVTDETDRAAYMREYMRKRRAGKGGPKKPGRGP